ncbi:MAG: glycosyltransferase family 4 protein [Candidatus Eremiobacteraeota bacterium]|nr:glycosyltransferase family 4 protein [Candidatus Eremiobacteraeota bacterium]
MRILVLSERVDAEGGTESYLRALLPALRARGHDVRVLARNVAQSDAYGVSATAVGWSDEHDPPSRAAATAIEGLVGDFAPHVAAIHNVLDAGVLDVVRRNVARVVYHVHDHRPFCPNGDRVYPQGGGVCALAMGTTTCGWHALVHGCAYGPRPRTLDLIHIRQDVARAVAACDGIVALSHYIAGLTQRNGIASTKTFVLPPPLEGAAFASAPAPRPGADAVLFAGRVVPSKGARSLVRALAQIPEPQRPLLHIAGDGPDLTATVAEARGRRVRVEMLGRLDAGALRTAYDGATLVAMPSLWGEPFGLVGIEAFARGRPVVAYDAGAIREWLSGTGAGIAVRFGDERALGVAIGELLARDRWQHAKDRAFAAAQTYRIETHVDRIEAIYRGDSAA